MSKAVGVRQRHTRTCTRPASGCRCRWEWTYEGKVDPTTGRRDQTSRGGYPTMRAAKTARAAHVRAVPHQAAGSRRTTVTEWLAEWLEGRTHGAGKPLKASTLASYTDHVERLLVPRLGRRPLVELTAVDIERAFASIKADHPRMRAASRGRVFHVAGQLERGGQAGPHRDQPVSRTSLSSSIPAPKVKPWTTEDLTAFLSHADVQADRLFPVLLLLAMSGLRRGEACGLRWSDLERETVKVKTLVDDAGTLIERVTEVKRVTVRPQRSRTVADHVVVENTAKSDAGQERPVILDPDTVAVLTEWRARQARERWDWSEQWRGQEDPYLFTEPDGWPVDPEKVTRVSR